MCQNKHFQTWPWKAAKWSLSKVDPTIGTSWNLDPFEPPGGPKDSKISFSNFLFLQAYKLFLSVLLNFFLSKSRGSGIKSSFCGQILATIWRWKFIWRLRIVLIRTCFDGTLNESNIAATESDSHSLAIAVRQSLPVHLHFQQCFSFVTVWQPTAFILKRHECSPDPTSAVHTFHVGRKLELQKCMLWTMKINKYSDTPLVPHLSGCFLTTSGFIHGNLCVQWSTEIVERAGLMQHGFNKALVNTPTSKSPNHEEPKLRGLKQVW